MSDGSTKYIWRDFKSIFDYDGSNYRFPTDGEYQKRKNDILTNNFSDYRPKLLD